MYTISRRNFIQLSLVGTATVTNATLDTKKSKVINRYYIRLGGPHPDRYFNNSNLIRECFKRLGPYVKSCHAKDTILLNELTTHINEIRPGLGNLNYALFLNELSKLPDIPLMLEHLKKPEDYRAAAKYIRSVAKKNNIPIRG